MLMKIKLPSFFSLESSFSLHFIVVLTFAYQRKISKEFIGSFYSSHKVITYIYPDFRIFKKMKKRFFLGGKMGREKNVKEEILDEMRKVPEANRGDK